LPFYAIIELSWKQKLLWYQFTVTEREVHQLHQNEPRFFYGWVIVFVTGLITLAFLIMAAGSMIVAFSLSLIKLEAKS